MNLYSCVDHSGINGWHPIYLPALGWDTDLTRPSDASEGLASHGLERVVGGLELSTRFAHSEDLNRVMAAARSVGWEAPASVDVDGDCAGASLSGSCVCGLLSAGSSADELLDQHSLINVELDTVCFPLNSVVTLDRRQLDLATRCFARYKLYDRQARCSRLVDLRELNDDYVEAHLAFSRSTCVPSSSPFPWCVTVSGSAQY